MFSTELNEKIHVILTCALAFLIPVFPVIIAPVIAFLFLNWVFKIENIKNSINVLKSNYSLLLMVVFYILNIIGLIYSDNLTEGIAKLETKMSFLFLPLIYAGYFKTTKSNFSTYLMMFIIGCVLYVLFCFSWACYCYFKPVYTDLYGIYYDLGANYFYYTYLAKYFHPSYIAMYVIFSLASIWFLTLKHIIKLNVLWISVIILLSIYVLLLSSKAGWLGLGIWGFGFSIWLIRKKQILHSLLLLIFIIVAFLLLNVLYTPSFSNRIPKVAVIENAIKEKDEQNNKITTSDDGSARRVFVWKASFEVIKQNLFFGVGTGDTRDKLLEMYLQKGMLAEHKAALNSHNQYLNTGVALGIWGVGILLLCLILPLFIGFKQKAYLLIGFVLLISVNFLFESMFEKQNGVIFYTFFNTLLCIRFIKIKEIKKI